MESFFVALNAVLPMFIMLFIGFLVRKLKILQDSFLPQLNKIVFNVFFPFLMFNNIYGSDFSSGDIINVDVSTNLNGYFSDSSRMFCIGNVSEENRKLVEETKNAVYEGLKQVKPWGFLGDMGQAVNDYVKSKGYSVVREVGGHGIGLEFHEDPWVSYISKKGTEMLMVPGMIFTIEPMVNAGKPDIFVDEDNGWTIYTEDNSMSAQWEIQVLVTEDGYEIIAY